MSYDLNLILVDPGEYKARLDDFGSKTFTLEEMIEPIELSNAERVRLLQCLMNEMSLRLLDPEHDENEPGTVELIYESGDKAFRLFIRRAEIIIMILAIDDRLFDVVDECIKRINVRGDYVVVDQQRCEALFGPKQQPLKHRVKERLEATKRKP